MAKFKQIKLYYKEYDSQKKKHRISTGYSQNSESWLDREN